MAEYVNETSRRVSQKAKRAYQLIALMGMNILLAFVLVNLVLLAIFGITDKYVRPKSEQAFQIPENLWASYKVIYPGSSREEIAFLLHRTWTRAYVFEPFTQFKERIYKGRYVNVVEPGFRVSKNQGPWPPEAKYFTIFLFGGSTTFCYGLPDDQTIASQLQDVLSTIGLDRKPRVYNFGRGNYYSTQERILFEKLLVAGFVPDLAIFIDGLNDFFRDKDEPRFTDALERFFNGERTEKRSPYLEIMDRFPMKRFAVLIRSKLARSSAEDSAAPQRETDGEPSPNEASLIEAILNRYSIKQTDN